MSKTTIIFIETALELIPNQLVNSSIIQNSARKRGKLPSQIILDSSQHYRAMKKLPDSQKRGRPDIIHYCLLNLLGSPLVLNNPQNIEVYIHTVNNILIKVNPITRLPRHHNRFIGLMEQLLEKGTVQSKDELLLSIVENLTLKEILRKVKEDNRILFSSKGLEESLVHYLPRFKNEEIVIGIGAFPHGTISQEISQHFAHKISIYKETLDAWIVLNTFIFTGDLIETMEI